MLKGHLRAIALVGALMMIAVPAGRTAAVPLTGVTLSGGSVRLSVKPPAHRHWDAYLNGRLITRVFGFVGAGGASSIVGAGDGLRPGLNRFVVRVRDGGRDLATVQRFVVPGDWSRVDAGRDVTLLGPHAVRLSAAGSRPARGGRLGYEWVIARRPGRSHAHLVGALTAHPVLLTDVTGTYVVRLNVRETGLAGAPLSPPVGDTVQVTQVMNNFKRGAFINGDLNVATGNVSISAGPFAGTYQLPTNGVLVAFFDRRTMEPLPRSHPSAYQLPTFGGSQLQQIQSALSAAQADVGKPDVGMLLFSNSGGYNGTLNGFLRGTVAAQGVPSASDPGGPISLYAVPGVVGTSWLTGNNGNTNNGVLLHWHQDRLAGLFAPDNNGLLDFAPDDIPQWGTPALAFSSSPSGITVNGSTRASGADKPCPQPAGGFEVRVIDASTLADVSDPLNGKTFYTNACGYGTGTTETVDLHDFLQRAALDAGLGARLVFVQAVGTPLAPSPSPGLEAALVEVSSQIRALGGSGEAFMNNPAGTSGPSYAFVGKNFATDQAVGTTESTNAEVSAGSPEGQAVTPELSGVLRRDRRWRFVVGPEAAGLGLAGSAGRVSLTFRDAALAVNPQTGFRPTPFPHQFDPAFLKVLDYTARQTAYGGGYDDGTIDSLSGTLCYPMQRAPNGHYLIDIRALYCGGAKSNGGWKSITSDLYTAVQTGQVAPPPGLTQSAYLGVLSRLETEGGQIDNVNGVVADMTHPFTTNQTDAKLSLDEAVKTVDTAVSAALHEQQDQFAKTADSYSLDGILYLFSSLGTIAEELGGLFTDGIVPTLVGLASAGADVAAEFATAPDGTTPLMGPFVSGTTLSDIRTELASSYSSFVVSIDRLRDLIVSDQYRLDATKGLILTGDQTKGMLTGLKLSAGRFIWRTLMQSAFAPTQLVATNWNPAPVDARNYRCGVWSDPGFEDSQVFSLYFWRPWGQQANFTYYDLAPHIFDNRDNLAQVEGTYIEAGGQVGYVLSSGGQGYPFNSYTNNMQFPLPYAIGSRMRGILASPPVNLPPGVFTPVFKPPDSTTVNSITEGNAASPQGLDRQLLFPQIVRAAGAAGKLQTLTCVRPSQNISNGQNQGYDYNVNDERSVPSAYPSQPSP